jgi:hypothetical protein
MDTFKIILRGGSTDNYSVAFRPLLITAIAENRAVAIDTYDDCVFSIKDVRSYEDENGNMIQVNSEV